MTTLMAPPMLVDLADWPGIVLAVSADGRVRASNGKLDALIGDAVVGQPFVDFLDAESSRKKWERFSSDRANDAARVELVLRARTTLHEPLAFSIVRAAVGGDAPALWLIEHPADPRSARLRGQVEEINAELATAQRALFKEQARLANALKELERSNAALDEFAHAASHDLKAPLRAIADYAEILSTSASPRLDGEERGYVERLGVLAAKMRAMIDAVLEYARAGRTSSSAQLVDSGELLREVVDFLEPPSDVTIEISRDLPSFELRRVPFEQVFRNLLSNAIKYRRAGGAHVRVSASSVGDSWEFVVADDGPGIAPSQQERIWRLFHTTRPGDGTGIGLALVKRLVEAEGGRVSVESRSGEGASFRVQWPKHARSTSAPAA
jgi:signal transduction histidine kinase